MAIEGPLKELGIHDVFQLLDLSRKTGTLRVTSELRDNDGTFGAYAQLGAAYRLNRRQSIGLEYRALFGTDVTLNGRDGDADYSQINLVFAVGF